MTDAHYFAPFCKLIAIAGPLIWSNFQGKAVGVRPSFHTCYCWFCGFVLRKVDTEDTGKAILYNEQVGANIHSSKLTHPGFLLMSSFTNIPRFKVMISLSSGMYKNLRTNLPKEVMAFPDFPFKKSKQSFVTHTVSEIGSDKKRLTANGFMIYIVTQLRC